MSSWTCQYCGQPQPVTYAHNDHLRKQIDVKHEAHRYALNVAGITCANNSCRKLTLQASLEAHRNADVSVQDATFMQSIAHWDLLPDGKAKPWPDYIPQALREDYEEACLIVSRSPKAAAALARRCVQGIIRDYCKIVRATLDAEIKALRQEVMEHKLPPIVTMETVDGIDHVRQVGNIGAHMEKDVSLIIPVDEEEADALIALIEMLFREWYVADFERKLRLAVLAQIAETKKQAKGSNVAEAR